MKIIIRCTLLFAALLLSACGARSNPADNSSVQSASLPLGHAGRWLTDTQGRVVVLHGLNMVYKRPPYAPDAVGFGDDDAAFLAAEGYNTVRLGVIYKAVEPQPGVYDDAYLDRIAGTVATLARHGIVSLLDFHQDLYNERFYGEGFPDWAVQDDGLPVTPDLGFDPNYLTLLPLERAYDHFWNNDPGPLGIGLQDRYAAAWRHVAARFKDNAAVMGYDLFNEPFPGTLWEPCAVPLGCPIFDAQLTSFFKRVIASIRTVDTHNLVWYDTHYFFNSGVDTLIGPVNDADAGLSFHDYCLTAQETGNALCDTLDDLVFSNAEKHVAATGDTLLLTEFGALDDAGNLGAMVDRADRNMVGWQEWHYCPCDDPTTSAGPGSSTQAIVIDPAKPPVGDNIKAAKLAVLSRPYPQVVAGTPKSYGFDAATGTFHLDYLTVRADGGGDFPAGSRSVIVLPARQYPAGYAVIVKGARIVSAVGARQLLLASCAGVAEITVSVSRTGTSSEDCATRI